MSLIVPALLDFEGQLKFQIANTPLLIIRCKVFFVAGSPVERHDKSHHAVYLLSRFGFVRLEVAGRVSGHHHVVGTPAGNRVAAVPDLLPEYQRHQLFGRR